MNRLAVAAATGLVGLTAWSLTPLASADPAASSREADAKLAEAGLAKRVVVIGLCDGVGRYRLVVTNGERADVDADLTVRGVPARSKWGVTTEATTIFGDGTAVTGVGDFGSARANRDGSFDISTGTPAGQRHTFHFVIFRGHDRCIASVSA